MLTTQSLTSSRLLCGFCPDIGCQTKLVFPSYEPSIECTSCGQRHEQKALREVQEVKDHTDVLQVLRSALLNKTTPKRGAEAVKVLGLSNYHCKLLSPILTRYGMDKKTGRATPLAELHQGETFDCSVLGDRCFLIDPEHIEVVGYGRDISGSRQYLADTFATIKVYNANEERLVPIHADGDGHCLVHAISRALVGRELFWHPLRINLKTNLENNLDTYKRIFSDFIDQSEWRVIIEECDPDFEPPAGDLLGLRNIHIFVLANVLKRPIILLDSLCGMQSPGDYSATFLPALHEHAACRNKSGELNKPLCIAWNSNGHNHYIPLVGIKGKPLPKLPQCLVPKAWGLPQYLVNNYIEFDNNGFCIIGGDKCLQDSYILRLTSAMEDVFLSKYGVHPALVADVQHYIYKRNGVVGIKPDDVTMATRKAVLEKRLYVCLLCDAICEQTLSPGSLKRGGALYSLVEQKFGKLRPDKLYQISNLGIMCSYNADSDELVVNDKDISIEKCSWCPSPQIRLVNGDGSIQYRNGDRTKTRSHSNKCKCGFKHYWDGKEYDGLPEMLTVMLRWNYKNIQENVAWFQNESDPSQNSNVYTVATSLVQKHFPGVFGSERLVQQVVDQILEQTKKPEEDLRSTDVQDQYSANNECPSKIIVTGIGTLHKEELIKSQAERSVRQRIRENAPQQQRRRSSERPMSSRCNAADGEVPKPFQSTSVELKSLPLTAPNSPLGKPHKEQMTNKMVKVVISDGRQIHLLLEGVLTCDVFLQRLDEELNISLPLIKKIIYGFPPKELVLPQQQDLKNVTLPFVSGDKVSVEIFQPSQQEELKSDLSELPIKDFNLLQKLQDLQNSNIDNLDTAISSLLLTATLANQNIWIHVQKHPQLFSSGGLFYLQMKRDIGLVDGKHCRLPMLPGKVFRYSAEHDRLELCLEPHGHFAVEPGIEEKVLSQHSSSNNLSSMLTDDNTVTDADKEAEVPGFSGVFIRKSQQILSSHIPFHGQGYSLQDTHDKRAPVATGGHDVSEDEKKVSEVSKRLEEEMETETDGDVDKGAPEVPETVRKGPGYSVINPEFTNLCNSQVERFRFLASQLALVTNDEDKDSVDCSTPSDSSNT